MSELQYNFRIRQIFACFVKGAARCRVIFSQGVSFLGSFRICSLVPCDSRADKYDNEMIFDKLKIRFSPFISARILKILQSSMESLRVHFFVLKHLFSEAFDIDDLSSSPRFFCCFSKH